MLATLATLFLTPLAGAQPGAPQSQAEPDGVQMFESPTLGRFLRKAQDFAARGELDSAIHVLQRLLEGDVRPQGDEGEPGLDAEPPDARGATPLGDDDPTHAVFSSDGRLYRPLRRLCQELLASLPDAGRALYREMYEVAAERTLQAALDAHDLRGLEAVSNRWFLTFAAARALNAAGDLLMHQGRYRAAIQAYRTLLDAWPAADRARVSGLSEPHVHVKIALCFAQMDEKHAAAGSLAALVGQDPGASIRLMGELVPLADLLQSELFRSAPRPVVPPATEADPAVLRDGEPLLPLWRVGFTDRDPYRRPAGSAGNAPVHVSDGGSAAVPKHSAYRPGTSAHFDGQRVAFLDHYRLRVVAAGSGLQQLETNGSDKPPDPQPGKVRARIPAYDWAALRVACDDQRYYAVIGLQRRGNLPDLQPVLRNDLVAHDRRSLTQVWTTGESKDKYAGVTFLATPTVFGQRLLVPVLVQGAYALQCVAATTGEPLFRVWLNAGGSDLARAPSPPVTVQAGTAFVLTNAGTVAAVDAYTGELHWVRRYERTDPYRPARRAERQRSMPEMQAFVHEANLAGFVPSELLVVDGRILVAPCNGDALLCLDGASGDLLWVVAKPEGKEVLLLGHDERFAYVLGAKLMAVELRTGIRHWAIDPPESGWLGRGLVAHGQVVLPGQRCLWSLSPGLAWSRVPLPAPAPGEEPLGGPVNLFAEGPYVLLCYDGGIEAYASLPALHHMVAHEGDPSRRAELLLLAGDVPGAVEALGPMAADASRPGEERARAATRALRWVRDLALEHAEHGSRAQALEMLDRAKPWLCTRDLEVRWQLARYELMQALQDLAGAEQERALLYGMMERQDRLEPR